MNVYRERISYDANGNITNYIRRGGNATFGVVPMDSMTYSYYATSNKLSRIEDNLAYTGNFLNDLDNQTNNNYTYDDSGNLTADAQSLNTYTWTAYGKLRTVTMPGSKTLTFGYDAMQNRVLKEFNNNGTITKTFYLRDASGNILATYELAAATLKLKELNLYGSSRLGMFKPDFTVYPVPGSGIGTNYLNKKQYELTNHLGNVLAVVTDNRSEVDSDNNGTPNYYEAVVAEAREYYPFGMVMPNRKTPAAGNSAYRYGFNGKENDDEPLGDDNEQDYGMRIYDPRVGRFLSVDPIANQYPWYTPYQFAGNKPIWAVDLDGLEEYYAIDATFIGKSGKSTEIRVITTDAVVATAKENLACPKCDHSWLIPHSQKGYTNPDQAALEWAFLYQGKTHSYIYDKEIGPESREYGAMIGSKKTKDGNGLPITLYVLGTLVGGSRLDEKSVDVKSSKTFPGWDRKHGVHSHSITNQYNTESSEFFSPYQDDFGQTGDKYYPISLGINLYLSTPQGKLKVVEGDKAKERFIYGSLPHFDYFDFGKPSVTLKTWFDGKEWQNKWQYPTYQPPVLPTTPNPGD